MKDSVLLPPSRLIKAAILLPYAPCQCFYRQQFGSNELHAIDIYWRVNILAALSISPELVIVNIGVYCLSLLYLRICLFFSHLNYSLIPYSSVTNALRILYLVMVNK